MVFFEKSNDDYTRKGLMCMNDANLYPKGCTIVSFVKAKRKEQGWTQVQLADYAGVGLRFVRELEQNKSTLRLDKVNQVLDLFSACVGPVPIDRSIYADG